jgi:hypothetical protein
MQMNRFLFVASLMTFLIFGCNNSFRQTQGSFDENIPGEEKFYQVTKALRLVQPRVHKL